MQFHSSNSEKPARLLVEVNRTRKCLQDGDGELNDVECEHVNQVLIEPLNRLRTALIVVDFQNDFVAGSLAIKVLSCNSLNINILEVDNKEGKEEKGDGKEKRRGTHSMKRSLHFTMTKKNSNSVSLENIAVIPKSSIL